MSPISPSERDQFIDRTVSRKIKKLREKYKNYSLEDFQRLLIDKIRNHELAGARVSEKGLLRLGADIERTTLVFLFEEKLEKEREYIRTKVAAELKGQSKKEIDKKIRQWERLRNIIHKNRLRESVSHVSILTVSKEVMMAPLHNTNKLRNNLQDSIKTNEYNTKIELAKKMLHRKH
jgi:mannitol-1-phosphate/altronate dehydrogenase